MVRDYSLLSNDYATSGSKCSKGHLTLSGTKAPSYFVFRKFKLILRVLVLPLAEKAEL